LLSILSKRTNLNFFVSRYFASNPATVKVFVGPKRQHWAIVEDLLCNYSEYFRAAFKGNFKEAINKEIRLEEDDPAAFGKVIDWLFGETLACSCTKDLESCENILVWYILHILADKLGIEELMKAAFRIYETCADRRGNVQRS
jgi:hypothetical protein